MTMCSVYEIYVDGRGVVLRLRVRFVCLIYIQTLPAPADLPEHIYFIAIMAFQQHAQGLLRL